VFLRQLSGTHLRVADNGSLRRRGNFLKCLRNGVIRTPKKGRRSSAQRVRHPSKCAERNSRLAGILRLRSRNEWMGVLDLTAKRLELSAGACACEDQWKRGACRSRRAHPLRAIQESDPESTNAPSIDVKITWRGASMRPQFIAACRCEPSVWQKIKHGGERYALAAAAKTTTGDNSERLIARCRRRGGTVLRPCSHSPVILSLFTELTTNSSGWWRAARVENDGFVNGAVFLSVRTSSTTRATVN